MTNKKLMYFWTKLIYCTYCTGYIRPTIKKKKKIFPEWYFEWEINSWQEAKPECVRGGRPKRLRKLTFQVIHNFSSIGSIQIAHLAPIYWQTLIIKWQHLWLPTGGINVINCCIRCHIHFFYYWGNNKASNGRHQLFHLL